MKYKSIDLQQALDFVSGDEEFLAEVLNDLLNEVNTSEEEMRNGIAAENFSAVMKAAHRIKGAASSLYCGPLTEVSQDLQMTAKEGIPASTPTDKKHEESKHQPRPHDVLWKLINELFAQYCEHAATFRSELEQIQADKN